MLRCLLFGATLCLPVALDAQTNAASPTQIDSLQMDMYYAKKRILELITDMDGRTERIKALEVENYLLNKKLTELETRIKALQADSPAEASPDGGTDTTISPSPQLFVAHTHDSGGLISLYRREIDSAQAENFVAEADCETVGAWFEDSFSIRDYNAFFVRSDRGVRVCEKLINGWHSLRAGETKRAHVITEPF